MHAKNQENYHSAMIRLDKNKPLNIYRASAGSGKTHLLTGFYIKQLFQPELLPESHANEMHFSEILAVTFTNKATAEMKGRIIDQLYILSQNPEESDYWEDVNPDGKKTPEQVRQKAKDLLVMILNDYASFNISTIDSFFQKVVRSFARELNVTGNYEVEMDVDKILDATIANFLEKLDERNHKDIFEWLVKFSQKRSEDGAGWDFREPLFKMAKKALTSEDYRNHSLQIKEFTSDKKALAEYEKMLRQICRTWKEEVRRLGQEGLDTLHSFGLETTDFSRSFANRLKDWAGYESGAVPEPSETFKNAAVDSSKWFIKKSPYANGLPQAQTDAILDIFSRCVEHFTGEPYRLYCTASAIEKNFYELGLLANIDEELKAYCDDQNLMLISSTNELLSRIIGPDDAPFIYEKTGTRLKSYMIDEFQDTSGMQWNNFKPLIDNALSQGYQNLIVGDVKQSIYRWRGSDWGLLDSQLNHYHPTMHQEDGNALRTNWRSLPAIVDFNNRFFEIVAQQFDELVGQPQVSRIYQDIVQQLPEKRLQEGAPEGLVHVEFFSCLDEDGNPIEKPNADQKAKEAMRRLPLQIIRLQEQGFRPKDIAILCRKKSDCCMAAQALLEYRQAHPDCPYGMDIISNEALQISSHPSVKTIINVMRHLQNPESDIQRMVALTSFFQLEGRTANEALDCFFEMNPEDNLFDRGLAHHPLYEMTEQIISRLPMPIRQNDAPFLQAFRDLVLTFSSTQGADMTSFLTWWDQTGKTQSIATPEGQDAIQIMTIHKSKGLGMPAVILPYASWDMDLDTTHGEIIWCEPKEEPFKKDILLPIKLDKSLANTIFDKDFAEERLRAIIDNLNTAYVAFTRAKEALIIMAPKPSERASGNRLEDLLAGYCSVYPGGDEAVSFGSWERQNKSTEKRQDDAAITIASAGDSWLFPEANPLPKVTVLHSPMLPDVTAKHKGTYIHRALQGIRSAADYSEVIHTLYLRGIIDPEVIEEQEMQQTIGHLLSNPDISPWFREDLRILNEQTLADKDGQLLRPDRIIIDQQGRVTIIDYKTGNDHKGYRKQVATYMSLMRQIGFSDIEGYLLFIKDEKVVKIKG